MVAALIWLVPDRRVERFLARENQARVSADRVEPYGGEEYVVRRVTGSASTKPYRCPGCHQVIRPATPHTVAWPVLPSSFASTRRASTSAGTGTRPAGRPATTRR